jgi:hypothetical protein
MVRDGGCSSAGDDVWLGVGSRMWACVWCVTLFLLWGASSSSSGLSPTTTRAVERGGSERKECTALVMEGSDFSREGCESGLGRIEVEPHPGRRVDEEAVVDAEYRLQTPHLPISPLARHDDARDTTTWIKEETHAPATDDIFVFSAGSTISSSLAQAPCYGYQHADRQRSVHRLPTSTPLLSLPRFENGVNANPDQHPPPSSRKNSSSTSSSVPTCTTQIRASIEYRESRGFQTGRAG